MDRRARERRFWRRCSATHKTNSELQKEQIEMKRILTFVLALSMALSLAACGGKADDNKGKTEVTMTAQEIMDTLKEKLGDSFGCDVAETEDNISGYWGLDMGQVESWASMSNSNSAVNSSYAVIVKVITVWALQGKLSHWQHSLQLLCHWIFCRLPKEIVTASRTFLYSLYSSGERH